MSSPRNPIPSQPVHPQKGPFLRELAPGERFVGFYVVRSKQLEPFRDPARGKYLTLVLGDRSGELRARVWDDAESADEELEKSTVIKLEGEVETYLDRPQIRVLRIRPAGEAEFDLRDMLPSSDRDPDEMLEALQVYLERIENPHLRALVDFFFTDEAFLQRFKSAPAARKIHHAYLNGLLEHTLEVLKLCTTILELYPQIDSSLLLSGAVLHDIGKLREFTWDFDIDYSDDGRLLGHIVLTDEMVTNALASLPDFPPQLAMRLRHMLLAHHGKREWGSPRRPKTLEAIALHHVENLDAQINRFHLLLESAPPGESWTYYNRLLGRQLYKGQEDDELSAEEQGWTE